MSTDTSHAASQTGGWQPGDHRMVTSEGLRYHIVASGQGPVVVLVAGFPKAATPGGEWRRCSPGSSLSSRSTCPARATPTSP